MASRQRSRFSFFSRGEDGQLLITAAGLLVLMLGFAALAIDIGYLNRERRDLQNAADAMALAGGSQIKADGTGNGVATTVANTWATNNDIPAGEIVSITFGVTCDGEVASNTITVRLSRTEPTFLSRFLGIDTGTVGVCATAARYSSSGSIGMRPFGVEDNCVYGPDGVGGTGDAGEMQPGTMITIKYDANNDDGTGACGSNTGNFWTLAIDSTGSGEPCGGSPPADSEDRKLKEAICYGAITPLCTPAGITAGEDCQITVDTQTGNQVGGVRDSINYLVDNVPANCDTLAEIVTTVVVGGVTKYTITDDCNPFLPGYEGVSLVFLIPVLNGLFPDANGHSNVPIVDFMIVVVDPAQVDDNTWCKGNDCDLQAMMVNFAVNPTSLRKGLNDDALSNFTVLVN